MQANKLKYANCFIYIIAQNQGRFRHLKTLVRKNLDFSHKFFQKKQNE